jgi:hypothetical protein
VCVSRLSRMGKLTRISLKSESARGLGVLLVIANAFGWGKRRGGIGIVGG